MVNLHIFETTAYWDVHGTPYMHYIPYTWVGCSKSCKIRWTKPTSKLLTSSRTPPSRPTFFCTFPLCFHLRPRLPRCLQSNGASAIPMRGRSQRPKRTWKEDSVAMGRWVFPMIFLRLAWRLVFFGWVLNGKQTKIHHPPQKKTPHIPHQIRRRWNLVHFHGWFTHPMGWLTPNHQTWSDTSD